MKTYTINEIDLDRIQVAVEIAINAHERITIPANWDALQRAYKILTTLPQQAQDGEREKAIERARARLDITFDTPFKNSLTDAEKIHDARIGVSEVLLHIQAALAAPREVGGEIEQQTQYDVAMLRHAVDYCKKEYTPTAMLYRLIEVTEQRIQALLSGKGGGW